ncbi:MAG: hypothetical protein IJ134_03325 [Bacilli bacterium]|nr:hypothetical protein [Bacilli bacterium]
MKKVICCILESILTITSFIYMKSKISFIDIFLYFIIFILLNVIYYKYKRNNHLLINLFSLFISFVMIIGKSFDATNSVNLISKNIILSITALIGYYSFYKMIISIIINNIDKFINYEEKYNKKHIFIFSLAVILLGWSIYIIAFYPGILSPDPSNQILQFFNVDTLYIDTVNLIDQSVKITNHHPVLHTVILGGLTKIGHTLGNDNLGIFMYTILQVLILSSVLAYTIKYLEKLNIPKKYLIAILLIYAFVPHFPFYAISLVKDTIYSSLIILYVICIFDLIYFKKNLKIKNEIFILLLILLISMFRNNGVYLIILTFPLLFIFNKDLRKKLITVFILFLVLSTSYTKILLPYFKITDGSIREALSVPFQQTARLAKYHGKNIEKSDKMIIDKVLTYDTLKDRYDPNIADPVKNEFNKDASKNDIMNYFKVWSKYLVKYPNVYVDSFINNTYGYFYPNTSNWYIYHKYDTRVTSILNYHYNDLSFLRKVLHKFGVLFRAIPVIGLISNIGFSTLLIMLLCVISIINKKKKFLIVLSPLLISILFCLVSPVNTYFRYALPYIFCVPLIINLMYYTLKNK